MNSSIVLMGEDIFDDARWDIDRLVSELRVLREKRQQARPVAALPSRQALQAILEGLINALFPHRSQHLDLDLAPDGLDHFVGHSLGLVLTSLQQQLQRELLLKNPHQANAAAVCKQAANMVAHFTSELPSIHLLLQSDIKAAYDGDPAALDVDEILACYPGITANIHYRIAHILFKLGARQIARMISEIAHSLTDIDIHPGARIGEGFFIDHGTGVVIGETAVIGNRVRLYQAVTLGAKRFPTDEDGNLLKGGERHPILEDDVVVYAGATILGRITIGKGSVIGGGVWLTRSVPPDSNISQAKIRIQALAG
jgi:serine O-acetyltransferase